MVRGRAVGSDPRPLRLRPPGLRVGLVLSVRVQVVFMVGVQVVFMVRGTVRVWSWYVYFISPVPCFLPCVLPRSGIYPSFFQCFNVIAHVMTFKLLSSVSSMSAVFPPY